MTRYLVLQAHLNKFQGIKVIQHYGGEYESLSIFPTKEDAQGYLNRVKEFVRNGIKSGKRKPNELKDKVIDWMIIECEVNYDRNKLKKKGWKDGESKI